MEWKAEVNEQGNLLITNPDGPPLLIAFCGAGYQTDMGIDHKGSPTWQHYNFNPIHRERVFCTRSSDGLYWCLSVKRPSDPQLVDYYLPDDVGQRIMGIIHDAILISYQRDSQLSLAT